MTALVTQRDFSLPYHTGYGLTLRAGGDLFPGAFGSTSVLGAGIELGFGAPRPNPFRISLAIPYGVPETGPPPTAEILDVRGRRVRVLTGLRSGAGVLEWDGHDAQGRPAAAGVYFVRLRGGGDTRVVRVVKLR